MRCQNGRKEKAQRIIKWIAISRNGEDIVQITMKIILRKDVHKHNVFIYNILEFQQVTEKHCSNKKAISNKDLLKIIVRWM